MTLKYAKNAFAAGTDPRTPLGELTTFPRPSPHIPPSSAPAAPRPSLFRRSFLSPSVLASRRPPMFFDKSNTDTNRTYYAASSVNLRSELCLSSGHHLLNVSDVGTASKWMSGLAVSLATSCSAAFRRSLGRSWSSADIHDTFSPLQPQWQF